MGFWPFKNITGRSKVRTLFSVAIDPKKARAVLGIKNNLPAGKGTQFHSRRDFIKRGANVALGLGVLSAVVVNVVKREKLVSSRRKLLKRKGVENWGEWARVKTPLFEPVSNDLNGIKGKKVGFSISSKQANGMNIVSSITQSVFHDNANGIKPTARELGTMVSLIKKHWTLATKNGEGIGNYVSFLKNSLEWEDRRAAEALDLLLINPSTKREERDAVWQLLWGKT
ncbi:MAG: hypothetical protein WCI04_05370 [archaeon]